MRYFEKCAVILLLILLPGFVSAQFPTNGLVALYLFNENVNDESGNGNHATNFGATLTADRCGIENKAYFFNGTGNYIDLNHIYDFPSRTINLWFSPEVIDDISRHIYISDNPNVQNGFTQIKIFTASQGNELHSSAGIGGNETEYEISENAWYMVTIAVEGDSVRHYVNGIFVGSFENGNITSMNGYQNALLGTSRVFDRFYNGKIDDIAIYNRSLSAEEVWMLYLDNCQLYTLDGEPMVCQGQQNMVYHATDRLNTTYDWSYSGTGVGINQNSNEVTLHFSDSATSGTLKVIISGIDIATRTLDMHVVVNPLPGQAGMISGDTIVCRNLNEYLFSIPIIENATGYLWTYGGTGATIMGSSNTIAVAFAENATSNSLIVSGTNSCGSGPLSKPLYIYADQCDLNIPNSFSPNNDAVNQEFFIRNLPANSKLTIFNRLGKVLWKSDNYQNEWDGRDNHGYQLDSDTYWYVLIVPGIKKEFSGFVYLKR